MGIRSSIKIEGLNELRRALRDLPGATQARVLANAVASGARVIRNDARDKAPVLAAPAAHRVAGTVRDAIRATRGVRRGSEASAFVSVRRLSKKQVRKFKAAQAALGRKIAGAVNPADPFYWRFLEFGTAKMAARPFLRPAFDTRKEAAALQIKEALRAGIEREAQRLRGKVFK